jgi:hypothetical protein
MPLWVLRIAKNHQLVAIFARGDVTQGECRPNHIARLWFDGAHILDDLMAQSAFKQGCGQCGNRHLFQLRFGFRL